MTQAPTVYLVDDELSVREALSSFLRAAQLPLLAFGSAGEFLAEARFADRSAPACIVLDLRLPEQDGLEIQKELVRRGSAPPIIFITGHGDIRTSVQAMKAGAIEFITKPFEPDQLLSAVRDALRRDHEHVNSASEEAYLRRRLKGLTERERGVFACVTSGRSNKQIAADLGISEITVKVHRGRVMRKMSAKSLADLVKMATKLCIG